MAEIYYKQIRERSLKVGDLILREVTVNTKNPTDVKLGPSWEGPYEVIKVFENRAYRLRFVENLERKITSSWNTMHLKKYYARNTFCGVYMYKRIMYNAQ